ncbi:hypothetical protein A2592_02925 [Candidatus Kaiserbacteria bacterium RIFOXYD1_FULL_42_15]|uniref:Primosomal protein N' 3' DNA-binding domain-containing protein n=1 Tax=Candidatus Kaiserbacteria bacterium RIFOXYD1_FULL_42_15 TaxID=1798532 RepID=A0A1F6FTY4_9BACT|nr:MAG: hypothetical protein A2592_02925 [Candidatus Kaiserbacteria bacterium RIFOXYD1_FULL_42_15]
MFVIEVIPLVRGGHMESLSYFSSSDYHLGTCVSIPVRGRTIIGIVIDSKPVSSTKTALKAATFSLRKLPEQQNPAVLGQHLLKTVADLYKENPAKSGTILFALLPPDVRNGIVPYPVTSPSMNNEDSTPQILSATTPERFIAYKSMIRSAFAHRGSVTLVVPTTPAVDMAFERLSQGISDRVIRFSSHQTKKERSLSYNAFSDLTRATLTITTPNFAYLDRGDCTCIIIEEAASSHYVMRARPNLDHREVLKLLAKNTNRNIILGDAVTRTEDEYKRREDIYQTYNEHPKRLSLPANLTIITQSDKPTTESPFQLFSPELTTRIKNTLDGRHNVFLFAARRGIAPVVACFDCGYIFRCPDSGTPYSLLRTHGENHTEERWFISSTSGKRIRAADVCPVCGSWRLRERGIGIQHVYDECQKLFPRTLITVFDHTTATTHKRALAIKNDFQKQKGGIMLGTQMIMPYLPDNITLSSIVSLDAVRAIPTWRADESLFRLLINLREKTDKEVIIQTRNETDDLLLYATRGAVDRFHDDELALRKMLNYPPFSTFVFITWQGSPTMVQETENLVQKLLAPLEIKGQFYTNPNSTIHKLLRHCLIRVPNLTDNQPLIQALRSLPPHIAISINPDRIV